MDCTNTYSMCSRSTSQSAPFWPQRTEFGEANLNFRVPDLECFKEFSYIAGNKPVLHMDISCNTYIIFLAWHLSCKLIIMAKVMYNVKVTCSKCSVASEFLSFRYQANAISQPVAGQTENMLYRSR